MPTHHCQTHDELYPVGGACKKCAAVQPSMYAGMPGNATVTPEVAPATIADLAAEITRLNTQWEEGKVAYAAKCERVEELKSENKDLRGTIAGLKARLMGEGEDDDPPEDEEWSDVDPEEHTITLPPVNADDEPNVPADDDKPIIERHPYCDTHPEELATGHVVIHHTELRRICGKCVQPNRPTQNDIKP